MSRLWIWLSLLCALQSSVSSDGGVLLLCNNTVEVKAGGTVTLNCTIKLKLDQQTCTVKKVEWKSTNAKDLCITGSCESDNQTYVSLTITNVMKEEHITVIMHTPCGMDSSSIKVKLSGMSLICSDIVEVQAGDDVTLNCSIKWQPNRQNCRVQTFDWKSTNGTSLCTRDPAEGICMSDNQTYVSLTITNIKKEEDTILHTHSNCGIDSSSIKVKLSGMSLNCKRVEVQAGGTVTLNCSIKWQPNRQNCSIQTFDWKSTNGTSICTRDPTESICTSDYQTYVSLTITNITKEENITVHTQSNCGKDSSSIKVKLFGDSILSSSTKASGKDIMLALSVIFGVFATAIVVVILYLFKTKRRRKITKPADDHGNYSSTPQAE